MAKRKTVKRKAVKTRAKKPVAKARIKKSIPKARSKTAFGLLGEVAKLIVEEPLRYDQTEWLDRKTDDIHGWSHRKFPSCGTVGCVAGWVAALTGNADAYPAEVAAEVLGLSSFDADELFDSRAAKGKPQTKAHALSGAKHIERFRQEHRAELLATPIRKRL